MASGNLGMPATRERLRRVVENELMQDWQVRLSALEAIGAPDEVQTLHNLYVKIAKENIAYAKDYATWLVDKNGNVLLNSRKPADMEHPESIEGFNVTDFGNKYFRIGNFYHYFSILTISSYN